MARIEILLTSEKFVKEVTNISDNIAGKYVLPAIREAQERGLKGIVGSCLLARVKELYRDGLLVLPEYEPYRELVERSQYYLAYTAMVELAYKVSFKFANAGLVRTNDDNVQNVTADEVDKLSDYYQAKADGCAYELQGWLLENRRALPELDDCACARIKSNLRSAATCGVWLGGFRGRRL